MDWGAAGAASGLGKVRLLLAAGSGGGGKRGGGDPLVRGQKCGIGETPCRSWVRGSEARSARGGHGEGAGRGSPVWSPGLRPPARGSLQSPRNPSALRVWQRCKEKGSSGAARSCSSPSCPPTPSAHPGSRVLPLPALRPRPPAPDPARNRSPCRANLEQPLASLGRNLGPVGSGGASHSRSWNPGAARVYGSSGPRKRADRVWSPPGGTERTCRSAWSKDCSVAGGGERPRRLPAALGSRARWGPGTDPCARILGTYLTFQRAILKIADKTWNCHIHFFGR